MFERIEAFFRRLDTYTEVAPNQGMVDTMSAIMVEALNFIGTATKEIKQGRTSKRFLYKNTFPLTNLFTEKYAKKLMGKNDIEDALKKLDRLTQEEAVMAAAQFLKVANRIDNSVEGIADNVLVVDNRVANVDDRVAGVDEHVASVNDRVAGVDERVANVDQRVAGVGDRVASVDDRVKDVDDRVKHVDDRVKAVYDKVATVGDGAQYIFHLSSKKL